MPFNFPASPTVGQESVQNGRNYKWTGSAWEIVTVYTDFSSNVNALLPVIANNSDNRVLTGTGSTTGINAENNLTFDGSLLNVGGSGVFTNNVIASGFVRSGGTSSQFLKGDGSVDNNSYYLNSNPSGYTTNVGTVTNVSALTIGTTGTDISSSVANGATTPVITINIPTASASNRGVLSSSDWTTFNNKQPSGNYSTVGHNHNINDIINLQSSLDLKSNLNSPSFTGTPTAPTAASGTNTNQIASTQFVRTEISNLVGSSPSTLDTLNELATALGNDANFATTVTNSLAGKASLTGSAFTGTVSAPTGNFTTLQQNGINVSVSGHFHSTNDITNFDSSVSGLLPITNILGGSNITVSQSGSVYTVAVTGSLGLTTEEVDDRVSNLLVSGSGIALNYDDVSNSLTISTSGLQPSGDYSLVNHTHTSSNIIDFNSSVSGLLPSNIVTGIGVSGYLTKWNGSGVVSSGIAYDTGSRIGIGTITPSGQLHVIGTGIFDNSIRLGSPLTSGTIIGLSATGTVPAIVFDTVGNNHGNNQTIYDFRENGSSLISIDGLGNLQANAGNIVSTASNPSTDNGSFIGQGMRRRTVAAGMEFAWGESITSATEPGIDLFPIDGTHITNGILFRLSKNSTKTDVAMLVNGSGNVGIGTAVPNSRLHIVGSGLISSISGTSPNSLLHLYSATSGASIFNVEGTNGSLFSVDDNLSGTLMSVNNNAGLPVFEVFSDDRVVAGRFNQNDFVVNSSGNIGIGNSGDNSYKLNISGNVSASGTIRMLSDVFTLSNSRTISTSGTAGTQGNICWDSNYLYVCIATNNWKRIAYDTW